MRRRSLIGRVDGNRSCVGTGMVILDLVFNQGSPEPYFTRSGGSCGNVLTILSYLGWEAYPVARLGRDRGAEVLIDDLTRFGVNSRFLIQEESGKTPAIVETIRNSDNGSRTHSYSLHCPQCGNYLTRHRPISQKIAESVLGDLVQTTVFYFDRPSRGAITLAGHYRAQGALIVFEPSNMREENLFKEAACVSHILKYSNERISDISEVLGDEVVPLEIQTLGRSGLRYRWQTGKKAENIWQYMPSYIVSNVIDEAGAGDWCTAGIVFSLGQHGAASFWRTRSSGIERALQLGQALAATSCEFPSARGAMYSLAVPEMDALVGDLISGQPTCSESEFTAGQAVREIVEMICGQCDQDESPRHETVTSLSAMTARQQAGSDNQAVDCTTTTLPRRSDALEKND